jgi:hypothetical protein
MNRASSVRISIVVTAAMLLGADGWDSATALQAAVAGESGSNPAGSSVHPGRKLAERTCTQCHLFPEPDLLSKSVWKEIVLKKMSFYTGVEQLDPLRNEEADLYKASGLFPETAAISRDGWSQIEAYYLEHAPSEQPKGEPRPEITVGLKHFRFEPPRFRREPPLTTVVAIDQEARLIYSGDATDQALNVLDAQGSLVGTLPVGNIPVSVRRGPLGLYVAGIGHFFPKEERRGQLILLQRTPTGFERKVLLSSLPRPAHLELADLNRDNQPELLLSMFGYLTGRFSWFDGVADSALREHALFNRAGALGSACYDFDGDGGLDVALLAGQESESLQIFFHDAAGYGARKKEVFRWPPSYGHTFFELADLDRDGKPDLVVCNGDNGDYESQPKAYHGIRLYLNQGQGDFALKRFLPLHGAFAALARDYDGDGDLDIAAIGFYPDYETNPRESFVYYENTGDLSFKPSTFKECISGRWLVMDAGDLDGDGDLDIVLGSMIRMPSKVPGFLKDTWEKMGPSVVILRNTLKDSKP